MSRSLNLPAESCTPAFGSLPAVTEPLPLVSVIVVNFNYAEFLEQAIASIFAQSYPQIECVVVDDASTDDTSAVLCRLEERYPDLGIIRRSENGGQALASLDGLAATSGHFVHFLDADDYVRPDFIATHVAAHLSLRNAVGFTCCDMASLSTGAIVSTCDSNISRYIGSKKKCPAPLRPTGLALAQGKALEATTYVIHSWEREWYWSAMSAVVFRRDALMLFADHDRIGEIRRYLDSYFCRGINTVTGSVLIDQPLAVYRLHEKNVHFVRAPLQHTITFDRKTERATTEKINRQLLEHVVANCSRFDKLFYRPSSYLKLLSNLAGQKRVNVWGPNLILIESFGRLRKTFGSARLIVWLLGIRV